MLTAGVSIGEVARYFEVSRRTIERIRKGAEGAVARWKRGVGRPPVPATVRERMRALIAEDPEEAPLEVLRRLREEGRRLGESTFYRLHRAEREGLPKELMVRFEGVAGDSSGSGTSDSRNGASAATSSASTRSVGWSTRSATARWSTRMAGRYGSW
jgi:DNA-binding transcriptional ArsR family regulator